VKPRVAISLALAALALLGTTLLPRVDAALVRDAEGCPGSGNVPSSDDLTTPRVAILCLLNEERARYGLPALRQNAVLELASQRHSEDMGARNFFEHDTPEGVDPSTRTHAAGYAAVGVYVGENIYWGEESLATPVKAVEGWMDSPGHRENILRPQFTEVGVGVGLDPPRPGGHGRSAVYTTDFGGPSTP
jgi:uncharacterized protein YkwD